MLYFTLENMENRQKLYRYSLGEELFFPALSFDAARERAMRSRCDLRERDAVRQISTIVSGFVSDLRRRRADRVFSFAVNGVEEFGDRIVE
jgi:hypothetical protein